MEVGCTEFFACRSGRLFFELHGSILFIDLVAKGCAGAFHRGKIPALFAALGGFSEIGDGLVGFLFGFGQNISCIFVGLLQKLFASFFKLTLSVLQGLAVFFERRPHPLGLFLFPAQLLARLFQVGEKVFKVLYILAKLFPGGFNDIVGKAQLLRDGKGITFAGNAYHEAVGGLQGLHIEFTACVYDAFRPHGVGLEFGIVGRGKCADPPYMAEIQDGDCQRRALGRVGSGTQLVKKTQTLPVDPAENIHDGLHMGRKGGKALLDALLITDVREDFTEEREFASITCRNMKTCHTHQFEEADSLERDRLAAGIGAGDNDHVIFAAQFNVDGNNFFRVDQRMAPLSDIDIAFIVKNRPGGILLHGKICAGENEIQPGHVFSVVLEFHEVFAGFDGKSGQDLLNLLFFLQDQFPHLIVERDNGSRLDKKCGARGGLIVNETGNLGLVFRFDRNTIAVSAQGDHIVLQVCGIGRVDHFCKLLVDLVTGQLHITPYLTERRRSVVRNLILGKDAAADLR